MRKLWYLKAVFQKVYWFTRIFFGLKTCIRQRCYLQWNLQWNMVAQLVGEAEVTESYYSIIYSCALSTSLQAPGIQGGVRNVICGDISIDSRFTEVDMRFKCKGNYSFKYHVLVSHVRVLNFIKSHFLRIFWKQKWSQNLKLKGIYSEIAIITSLCFLCTDN